MKAKLSTVALAFGLAALVVPMFVERLQVDRE
jgi:hypothetical protein